MNVFDLGGWAFGALGGLVAVDTIVPLVPSEAAVIVAAAAAGSPAAVAGVVAATAVGAVAGDAVMHVAGRRLGRSRLGGRLLRRLGAVPAARIGTPAVIFGRFVPGGRTAVALGTGMARMSPRRFAASSAAGATLWAMFIVVLGRLGARFTTNTIAQVAIGLGLALVFGAVVAGGRRIVGRRRRSMPHAPAASAATAATSAASVASDAPARAGVPVVVRRHRRPTVRLAPVAIPS